MHAMDFIHHLLGIWKIRVQKLHGVPMEVVAPILPVLNNAVQRNFQLAVLFDNTNYFVLAFIAFSALPVTVSPQRQHRHLPRQVPHLSNHPISITAVHKIIIDAIADIRFECCTVRTVDEKSG